MILLSEDGGKTIVDIKEWDDITDRPSYRSEVDPKSSKLKEIIGRYYIPNKNPCGLSNCKTPHNKGYLVVCDGGIETNIGNRCGQNHFGVEWKTLQKSFTRDTNAVRYRENIARTKNQIPSYEKEIQFIRDGDMQGLWCYNNMHRLMSTGFDEEISRALKNRTKNKDNIIKADIRLTEDDIEIQKLLGNTGASYRSENVETINGLNAVSSYKKLKTLLNVHLGKELEAMKLIDPDNLSYDELNFWDKWSKKVRNRIKEAEDVIEDCRRFLMPSNVSNIRKYKRNL